MNALTFTIELLEPMLATGLEGDPNEGISMHYIAGSVLRGAIINLFRRDKRKTEKTYEIDAFNEDVRNLFFNGNVCFLNSYPLIQVDGSNKFRSFPVPSCWHKEKDQEEENGKGCFDFWKTSAEEKDPNGEKQFKGLSAKYFTFKNDTGSELVKAEIRTRITVHNQRDAKKGRATKENGAIYRYESVEKGTKFGGVIISNKVDFLNKIKPLLENAEITVGGSRTGGYGRAKVLLNPTIDTNYQESKRWRIVDIEQDSEFSITLLSNALTRDENGQLQADLILENTKIVPNKTFKKSELVGGFNRKWGVQLPQMLSIKAGSVFIFRATSKIEASTIQSWLNDGIGERKLDGFGRVAVNLNTHSSLSFKDKAIISSTPTALSSENGKKNGQLIVNRIFKQKLDAELFANLADFTPNISQKNNHQISRLREFIHKVLCDDSLNTLEKIKTELKLKFFGELKSKGKDQFEKIRVNHTKIEKWILEDVLAENFNLFNQEKITLGTDGNKVESETQNQTLEYRLLLIDKVLERATKENRNNE